MTTQKRILTTTALGLLLAAAPMALAPMPAAAQERGQVLAQAEKPEGMSDEAWQELLRRRQGGEQGGREAPAEPRGNGQRQPDAEAPAPEPTPAPEEPRAQEPAPEAAPESQMRQEAPAEEQRAPEPEPRAAPEPEPEPQPEPEPEPEPAPPAAEEPAPAPEAPAAPEPAPAPRQERPAIDPGQQEQPSEPPAAEEAPAAEPPAAEEPAPEAPAQEAPPAGQQPDEAPAADEPEPEAPAETAPAEEPAPVPEPAPRPEGAAPAETPAQDEQPAEQPAQDEQQPEQPAEAGEEAQPENAAPVLDSQKEGAGEEAAPAQEETAPAQEETAPAQGEAAPEETAPADAEPAPEGAAAPPPETDADAQTEVIDAETLRTELQNILSQEGERIEMGTTREERLQRRRELLVRPEGAEVVREFNDNRTIIEINNQIYVESPDSDRLILDDDEVYYEQLPRERVREVVVRPDGVRIITVRNRFGDVVRRVRIAPDGTEQILVFVPDERLDMIDEWHDPAEDLPPLRLTIPVSEYILEAESVEDPDRYYTFLEQPPVEPVRRIYSLDEVKRSARVRDMVRRIDLDTIEFAFGSAEIEESEIDELEAIAAAIERMLQENPAETFLIEGHTDAVGSDLANLALSDRRAESVARALTDVFGIPPENLVTQGYGERYLKIDTQERERENRRVALRRITPLVAPVASAN
ncbi:OmpA family protein [Nitratireductor sp. ZSWI3]|uniref:OmpA family protein n=1 Tax=Nitratireductor sp. ZSWI3 TaxID=2966359 RepID=UPI00214F9AC1|nr:OmpA family protein [Nitratireductor sp. ZSWI3]MCR4269085.1 OmpA family protein [Nitratireductor sp. ZSWI3]